MAVHTNIYKPELDAKAFKKIVRAHLAAPQSTEIWVVFTQRLNGALSPYSTMLP